MADKRISQLVDRGTVVNNDVIPIVVSGAVTTNKATISSIQTFMQGNLDVGVTSVGITLGSTGTDVNVSGSPVTSSGNITINIPSASATNRGLVTTGAQTFAGAKTTTSNINVNGVYVGRGASGGDLFAGIAGNTSVGSNALISITTGFPNTALGSEALRNITTGANNIAIGSEAGKIDSGSSTANATSSSSIYIGDNTKPQTNGNTNEIVIGHATSGNGSNTVTIGTSSTTFNKFFGATQSDIFRLPSDGGGNQVTVFENIGTIHQGTASLNNFGFNNSNNIYFGKGLSNGGVIQWTNAAVRSYTLPDADGTIALTSDLSGYVTLATAQTITAQKTFTTSGGSDSVIITTTGAGFALDAIKAGNGEVIRVNKTSGTGNAMTVIGGNFEAPAIVKTGGTSSQFLMADGSVNTNVLASGAYLPLAGGTLTGALTITNARLNLNGNASDGKAIMTLGDATYPTATIGAFNTGGTVLIAGQTGTGMTIGTSGQATFSGALNGTSASFSGRITANHSSSGDYAAVFYNTSTTGEGVTIRGGSTSSHNALIVQPYNGATTLFNILATGAATFSSSVTATSFNLGNGQFLRLTRNSGALQYDALGIVAGTDNTRLISTGDFDVVNGALVSQFKVASTGAATFSSSVTAGGDVAVGVSTLSNPNSLNRLLQVRAAAPVGVVLFDSRDANPIGLENRGAVFHLTYGTSNILVADGASGKVGIGTASPLGNLEVQGANRTVASDGILQVNSNNSQAIDLGGSISFGGVWTGTSVTEWASISGRKENSTAGQYGGYLSLGTRPHLGVITERMRITSGGSMYVGAPVDSAATSTFVSGLNGFGAKVSNNNFFLFTGVNSSDVRTFFVLGTGDVKNTNNSYGAISDIKLKENIEDATPKLNDFMKVKVRNYNLIGDDLKQIGVIAQELEEVFPAMIDESEDFEEVELPQLDEEGNEILNEEGEVLTTKERISKGTTTKSVKYSVFVPMLIKAIQELKTEIDSLKNQIK